MSKVSIDKMFGLMLMAGWPKNQILKLLDELGSLHPNDVRMMLEEVSDTVSQLNYRLSNRDNENQRFHTEHNYYTSMDAGVAYESFEGFPAQIHEDSAMLSEIYEKVHTYLSLDLNLGIQEIVDAISSEIFSMHKGYIPPLSKKSLKNWLARLLNYYPPSEILHAVATVRNRYIGSSAMGWSLRHE